MRYGFFDDAKKEYVIQTPATPMPWINYLGSKDFFSLISNTAGGYCFYRDAKLQRLLRYRYNNVPADIGGRFFYIKEADKAPWSPAFHPCDTPLDSYRCRHGMGYTIFEAEKDGIGAELTFLVPGDENCEIQRVKLTNRSDTVRSFRFTGAVEWCLWNAVDDSTNFQRNLNIGELEVEDSVIYHKTEYRERRDHYAYYGVNAPLCGYDTDRDSFLGTFGSFAAPQAVVSGKSGDFLAHGGAPMAALHLDVTLAHGESKSFVFVLGYGKNPKNKKFIAPGVIRKDTAYRVMKEFSTDEAVDQAMAALKAYWDGLLSTYTLHCADEKLNRAVNIWHQYQCMVTYNMSRSASYFESGTGRGMGFRDSCQDLLGFVHIAPDRARERIIDIASVQWADGSTYHQYQPLTKRGNNDIGSGFNDDPLWLVAATHAYLAETGDLSILDHPTPFDNVPGSEAPLMEHLRRSVSYTMTHKGPHGLPLIGRADWNDCLNLGGGESAMVSFLHHWAIGNFVALAKHLGRTEDAAHYEAMGEEVKKVCQQVLWDGKWYIRGITADNRRIGTQGDEEGKVHMESNTWAVLSGVADRERGLAAMDAVDEYLFTEYGLMLNAPCYTRRDDGIGFVTRVYPGLKENGAIFSHPNPWAWCAEAKLGRGSRAMKFYNALCPALQNDKIEVRQSEPYSYCQFVVGRDHTAFGRARHPFMTGSAGWAYYAATQYLLGIQPDFDAMVIDPCIPADWQEYTVVRRWRGAEYRIRVVNPKGVEKGVASITLNGGAVERVPVMPIGSVNEVMVTMG